MQSIVGEDFDELYERAFVVIDTSGEKVESRIGDTLEINPCIMQLKNPRKRISALRGRKFNIGFAIAELLWILSGRGDYNFITHYNKQMGEYFDDHRFPSHGAYGIRLRKYGSQRKTGSLDQIKGVYKRLMKKKCDRQAVMMIWDPELDLDANRRDIPCNNWLHPLVRNNKLNWTQVVRSNDLLWGVPYNMFNFTVLQELFSSWLGVELGNYTHISDSLHIYAGMNAEVKKIMKHINGRHPFDFDHIFLYDCYEPTKISETYEQTHEAIDKIMKEEVLMRNIPTADFARKMGRHIAIVLDDKPFWLNCARVLLAYNAFKFRSKDKKLIDVALEQAIEIDNEFQFSILSFIFRKDSQLLFKVEDLIPKRIFNEFEQRYFVYPKISRELKIN